MARIRFITAFTVCALLWVSPTAAQEIPDSGYVVICPVFGEIDSGVAVVVERAVKEAANADAIMFLIDTPGGRVDYALDITKSISAAPCPSIAYIIESEAGMGAVSAGALISYACDYIVMQPGAIIGASMMITMGVEGVEAVGEKGTSFLRARYRALGEENGHNPLLGEAMVDPDIALYGYRNEDGEYVIYRVEEDSKGDYTAVESAKAEQEPPGMKKEDIIDTFFDAIDQEVPVPGITDELRRATKEKFEVADTAEASPKAEAAPAPEIVPKGVPEGAEIVSRMGDLLTLTASEAMKFGLIETTAETEDEALEFYGYAELTRHRVVPRWDEELFALLTSPLIASLLLLCGAGGIYLEVKTPGFGLPGIIGASCLAIFFGSHMVVGMAEWVDVLLVIVGLGLIAVEVFILPGFGVAGGAGILCCLVGFYLALTRVPIPEFSWDFQRLTEAGQTVTIAMALFLLFVAVTWKLLPHTPVVRWLVLTHRQEQDDGYVVQTKEQEASAIGKVGVAVTMLRPAGRARVGDLTVDVVTRGEYVPKGTALRIIQVEGNRYVVEREKDDTA